MKQKKLRAWTFFFYQSNFFIFFRDKPLIENTAANLMTSDPCQLKLTIEGSERSSRHDLGSIGTDLKPMQKLTPATACQVMTTFAPVYASTSPLWTLVGPFWNILKHLEQFWAIWSNFDQFWATLNNFEQFWAVFLRQLGSSLAILSIFVGQVWVMLSNSEQCLETRYGIVDLGRRSKCVNWGCFETFDFGWKR